MQNIVIDMCDKFHNDRLRSDRSLGNGKSDSEKKNNNRNTKKNVLSAWRPVSGYKKEGKPRCKSTLKMNLHFDKMVS